MKHNIEGGEKKDNIERGEMMRYKDIKYKWWREGGGEEMFYTEGEGKVDIEEIRRKGINCAGLINVIRRERGLKIPEITEDEREKGVVRGGTYHWHKYFEERRVLEEFDIRKEYEEGTLIIRRYRDERDQGHMAIIINKEEIIHAYAEDEEGGRVGITELEKSHNYIEEGYYEYAIKPSEWLGGS